MTLLLVSCVWFSTGRISAAEATASVKTGSSKVTMPVGNISQIMGGRTDIQAIRAIKEPTGLVWESMQAQSPDTLRGMLGLEAGAPLPRYQDASMDLLNSFRGQLEQGGMIQNQSYTLQVHQANLQMYEGLTDRKSQEPWQSNVGAYYQANPHTNDECLYRVQA